MKTYNYKCKITELFNRFSLNLWKNRRGVTVLELLISVAIGAVVTTAAMSLYITEHNQMLSQSSVSDMQSSMRAATQELASKIRLAGYKVPDQSLAIKASNTNPDTIMIGFDAGMTCGPVTLSAAMPQPSAELKVAGDISCIEDGDVLFIYDPTTRFGENFVCTNVQQSAMHIQHNTTTLHESYPAGSIISMQHFVKYYIDNTNTAHPNLMIQTDLGTPAVYAENITNLNISYVLSSGTTVDVPSMISMVREVVIRVDARSDQTEKDLQNRYLTRTLVTRVKVRNLGIG
jgi:prepilin-type N-terminal cleavage/methylation domain-containing protein